MMLMVIGGVLICAGLMLLFRRDPDSGSETRVKFKDFEIASRKPSLILICAGVVMVLVPYLLEPKLSGARSISGPGSSPGLGATIPVASPAVSSICCIEGGRCPMIAPEMVGAACFCADLMGNVATGTVCP